MSNTAQTTINPTLTFKRRFWGVLTCKETRLKNLYKLSSELAAALIKGRRPAHTPKISLDRYRFLAKTISSQLNKHKIDNVRFILECSSFSNNIESKQKLIAMAVRIALRELATHGLMEEEQTCTTDKNSQYQCKISITGEDSIAIVALKLQMPDLGDLAEIRAELSAEETGKWVSPLS